MTISKSAKLVALSSLGLSLSEVRVIGPGEGWKLSLPHLELRENKPTLLKYLSYLTVCATLQDARRVRWC